VFDLFWHYGCLFYHIRNTLWNTCVFDNGNNEAELKEILGEYIQTKSTTHCCPCTSNRISDILYHISSYCNYRIWSSFRSLSREIGSTAWFSSYRYVCSIQYAVYAVSFFSFYIISFQAFHIALSCSFVERYELNMS
jgi:hypothetical protein